MNNKFGLPLVSVVITNFNYGQYLETAVRSVFEQNYPAVECLLIDNNSTDHSRDVISRIHLAFPQLRVILREDNGGQCKANIEAFNSVRGIYVKFMDADDVLHEDCISTEVLVFLRLTLHVGFVCVDMAQTTSDQIVLGSSISRADLTQDATLLTDYSAHADDLPEVQSLAHVDLPRVHLVRRNARGWPWAATSAFLFRRDAVEIFFSNTGLLELRTAMDLYLARAINALSGSAVIERSLAYYRIHGQNIFSLHPHLNACHNFSIGGPTDENAAARITLLHFWFSQAADFLPRLVIENDFLHWAMSVENAYPVLNHAPPGFDSHTGHLILQNASQLKNLVGRRKLLRWAFSARVGLRHAVQLCRKLYE